MRDREDPGLWLLEIESCVGGEAGREGGSVKEGGCCGLTDAAPMAPPLLIEDIP